jgi:hypothetical protein
MREPLDPSGVVSVYPEDVTVVSGVVEYLNGVCADLTANGTTSRNLVALEFDPETAKIEVRIRETALEEGYPDLATVLRNIGQTCAEDHIGADQLRRVTFFADEIKLEFVSESDKKVVYTYPLVERPN